MSARIPSVPEQTLANRSRRVVFAISGSLGDVHPYPALALELKRRGHRPLIATFDRYRAAVENEGIEFAPMRPGKTSWASPRRWCAC